MSLPAEELIAGDRVLVHRDPTRGPGPWPTEPLRAVTVHPLAEPGRVGRPTDTTTGPRWFSWVVFDDPQCDADGDGPYPESEILDRYLERLGPLRPPWVSDWRSG